MAEIKNLWNCKKWETQGVFVKKTKAWKSGGLKK